MRETSASKPLLKHRNGLGDIGTGVSVLLREEYGGNLPTGHYGVRCIGGVTLIRAFVRNLRTRPTMPREKAQAAETARPKVLMRRSGADCSVVVMKRGNTRGAKGAGHRRRE